MHIFCYRDVILFPSLKVYNVLLMTMIPQKTKNLSSIWFSLSSLREQEHISQLSLTPPPIFFSTGRESFFESFFLATRAKIEEPGTGVGRRGGKEALQSFTLLRFLLTPLFSPPLPGISQQPFQQYGNGRHWQPPFTQTFPHSAITRSCLTATDTTDQGLWATDS